MVRWLGAITHLTTMTWQYTPYTIPLFLSAAIAAIVALYTWQRRVSPGAVALTLLMLIVAEWSLAYALEMSSADFTSKLMWAKFRQIAISFIAIVCLIFAVQYTAQEQWLLRLPYSFLLLLEPTITLLLAWTTEHHGLYWTRFDLYNVGNFTVLVFSRGGWFWGHVVYSYLLLLLATILLIGSFTHAPYLYRGQLAALLIGIITPWLGNALTLTGLSPFPYLHLGPFSFTVTGIALAWALYHYRFLSIVPVAQEAIIEGLSEGIIVLDLSDRIVGINPAAEQILNIPSAAVIGRPTSQVMSRWPGLVERYRSVKEANAELILGEGKKKRYYEFRISPLYNRRDHLSGRLVVLHDVTERKRYEETLKEARAAAEAAAHAKAAFLANMSHEIRTPLNAVVGLSGLLRDTKLTAEQREVVETINSGSDTLLAIINNILDFSKIEAGKIELESQPFDLHDCVTFSLNLLAAKANEKAIRLSHAIDPQLPPVFNGDVVRLRQILVNLIGNAVKFTEGGRVEVSVSGSCLHDGRYKLHFNVTDTGIGIPDARLDRLFQSFSQADSSTTRQYGGTGLGLAISKRLCELMGGTIGVESEVGVGSDFYFTVVVEEATGAPVRYLRHSRPRLHGKRVLIVAEDSEDRRLISRETRTWNMWPYVASSESEALYWIKGNRPVDVILIDVDFLQEDHFNLVGQIRRHCSVEELPLILLTAGQPLPQEIGEDEFAAALAKPVQSSRLNEVITGVFSSVAQMTAVSAAFPTNQIDTQMGQRHPLRILLVDDYAINQKVALRILERLGYRAGVASSGHEALAALRRQTYDLVLMDVQMPEMDGVETTRQILAQWRPAQRPRIVAMTAHALQGDRERFLEAGMDDYISKPIQIDRLVEVLYECLPFAPGNAQSPQTPEKSAIPAEIISPPAVRERDDKMAVLQPTTSSPITIDALEAIAGQGAMALLAELAPLFIQETPRQLASLRRAIRRGDNKTVRQIAHSMETGSASMGAMTFSTLCKEMERMGRHDNPEGAMKKVVELEAEYRHIKRALEAFQEGLL